MSAIATEEIAVARSRKAARGERPVTVGRIKEALRDAERASATGATGATILKLTRSPITRLIESKRIGPVEVQAATDIETAFMAISGALMFRPMSLERVDRGAHSDWSAKTSDAADRYQRFARHWSIQAKRGNPLLAVLIAAVVDQQPLCRLDADYRLRHGTAAKIVVRGLRDYAARAGWTDPGTAAKWKADAAGLGRMHPELRLAIWRAMEP